MIGLVWMVYDRRNLIFSISFLTPLTFLCFIFNSLKPSTFLLLLTLINLGVWLGRHICKSITQVYQVELRFDRNES